MSQKLLIVGRSGGTHLAGSLFTASQGFSGDLITQLIDTQSAYEAPFWKQKVDWHLLGRKPSRIEQFHQLVIENCSEFRPEYLIATGISPLQAKTLQKIRDLGTRSINFLTDDPWNSAHYAGWFLESLPCYGTVFSPRRIIMDKLEQIGCRDVQYLPFGYDSELFFPVTSTAKESTSHISDVMFAGGGDRDRIPYISALISSGIQVGLYGGYWERYSETKAHNRGLANIETLRLAIHNAKIALCLVRRANRDGHVMRTFEVPAVGACMLTEDTSDHREIFGEDGESVVYFKTIPEMVEKARWLLKHPIERTRLSLAAHQRIVKGNNTYRDRLTSMLR
jgi:spore maturation protein CgeB